MCLYKNVSYCFSGCHWPWVARWISETIPLTNSNVRSKLKAVSNILFLSILRSSLDLLISMYSFSFFYREIPSRWKAQEVKKNAFVCLSVSTPWMIWCSTRWPCWDQTVRENSLRHEVTICTSVTNEHNSAKGDWGGRVAVWSNGRLIVTWMRHCLSGSSVVWSKHKKVLTNAYLFWTFLCLDLVLEL